jgi:uncharacterized protein YjiS (DUF1127 family)
MSDHTANSNFSFHLPSLSYIDTRWEEQDAGAPVALPNAGRGRGLAAWLSRQFAAVSAWHRDNVAARELAAMTDHELMDIGVSRADLPRVFDAAHNQDLRQRGTYT